MDTIKQIQKTLERYKDKRIVIIGTTCTGKSTFARKIKNTKDMDNIIFPLLSKKEKEYVCKHPWTRKIGETMIHLVKERIKVEKGRPLFGTVLLECDLIIYLKISDKLLKGRCQKREAYFKNAKNMQKMIREEIKKSHKPVIKIKVG